MFDNYDFTTYNFSTATETGSYYLGQSFSGVVNSLDTCVAHMTGVAGAGKTTFNLGFLSRFCNVDYYDLYRKAFKSTSDQFKVVASFDARVAIPDEITDTAQMANALVCIENIEFLSDITIRPNLIIKAKPLKTGHRHFSLSIPSPIVSEQGVQDFLNDMQPLRCG